jgi:NADP-dependent 3-hydroxy acid dehydrogenase YdfG
MRRRSASLPARHIVAAAVAEAEAAFGPADCLVNNAGFLRVGDLGSRSPDDLDRDVDVLFNGVLHGIRAVLPGMTARRRGTIINVSSVGDRKPGPLAATYHASKAAVRSLSESLQQAEAKNNVRIINIAPGFVKTNIHADMGYRSRIIRASSETRNSSRLNGSRTLSFSATSSPRRSAFATSW